MTGFDIKGRSTRPWSARRESRIARAWRIAMAHMGVGEIPLEDLDVADPTIGGARPAPASQSKKEAPKDARPPTPSEDEVDRAAEESFPASDPPSWTPTHAGR